jgi:hypothetical protein
MPELVRKMSKQWYLVALHTCHNCATMYKLLPEDYIVMHGSVLNGYHYVESPCPICGTVVATNNPYWHNKTSPIRVTDPLV